MKDDDILKHLDKMYRHLMQLWVVVAVIGITIIIALAWGKL